VERSYAPNGEGNLKLTNELQVLIDALNKKHTILLSILDDSKKQYELSRESAFDLREFDNLVDHKDEMLRDMDNIDQGFDTVFQRIKSELLDNISSHTDEIGQMQKLIRAIIDCGAEISAVEMRTKESLKNSINKQRQELFQKRVSSKTVMDYYKASNQLNNLQPFFMDQKK